MRWFWSGVLLALSMAGIAPGGEPSGDLKLVWPSQQWSLDSGTTRSFVVGMETLTPPLLNISAWQMCLEIVPEAGASGSVQFNALRLPSSHVFAELPPEALDFYCGGFSSPSTETGLVSTLVMLPPFNIPVPLSDQGLLEVDLIASENAHGRFFVNAISENYLDTAWFADTPEGGVATLNFDGIPINSLARQSVEIGWVDVQPVPEPSSILLLTAAVVVLAGCSWRSHRGFRQE